MRIKILKYDKSDQLLYHLNPNSYIFVFYAQLIDLLSKNKNFWAVNFHMDNENWLWSTH